MIYFQDISGGKKRLRNGKILYSRMKTFQSGNFIASKSNKMFALVS